MLLCPVLASRGTAPPLAESSLPSRHQRTSLSHISRSSRTYVVAGLDCRDVSQSACLREPEGDLHRAGEGWSVFEMCVLHGTPGRIVRESEGVEDPEPQQGEGYRQASHLADPWKGPRVCERGDRTIHSNLS